MSCARLQSVSLTGERVQLVPLRPAHATVAYPMIHRNDEILRWLVWDGPTCFEDLHEAYSHWMRPSGNGDDYHFAILERKSGDFTGCIGPRFAGHPETGDVGYWLAPAYWGRGYMSEALRLVNHLAFRHLAATTMSAYAFVGNQGSRSVLEKCGYSLVHTAKERVLKGGHYLDEWYFVLLAHEYEARFGDWRPVEESVRFVP